MAAECWQKDAEMEQYRASKGKGKAKGSSKGEWEDPSKGSWSKSSWKGKGNPWRSRKGTYWFDQTNCSWSDGDRAWAFSVEAGTAQDSSEFLNPKISCKPKVWETTRSVTTRLNVIHVGCIPRFRVDSVDELRSSSSTRGISMPNFEVLDARIASALNKVIHNSQFKRRISLEEQKSPERGPFPSWKTDRLLDLRLLPGHW